jgi:Fe-S-cluster containining protein
MITQLRGKVRRAVVGAFLSEGDRAALETARRGACDRCGACCKILFNCPFLAEDESGKFSCSVYDHRPPSCRLFPMVPADLREVDRCGFTFAEPVAGSE